MKLVVIGGHSRSVGKTSVAAALIAATRELDWTAVKLTQYGHGVCSSSGQPCGCAVDDPECPYSISRETALDTGTDTARLLQAGAAAAYWARAPFRRLAPLIPELTALVVDRPYVIVESNSIVEFWRPDLYLQVLRFDVADFKESSRRFFHQADAYVRTDRERQEPCWPEVDRRPLVERPIFVAEPPGFRNDDLVDFCLLRLGKHLLRPAAGEPRYPRTPAGS
jgi:hypothetical protein